MRDQRELLSPSTTGPAAIEDRMRLIERWTSSFRLRGRLLAAAVMALAGAGVQAQAPDRTVHPKVYVRRGYKLTVAEATLKQPRFMETGPDGTLFVSQPDVGEIKACRDRDGDGYYESIATFVSGHRTAHGMFWHDGWLWFTEGTAIFRARDTDGDGRADETVAVIPQGRLPGGSGHWWRPILIHQDRLYTAVGDSGNITDEPESKRQTIWTYALDGSDERRFCTGLRNTEKLVVRPGTNEIWGMDHGSDWFGRHLEDREKQHGQPITDYNPPCEMNHYIADGFYGHPFIVGNRVPRYEFIDRADIVELAAKTIPPEWCTGAHWAPNAMEFYAHDRFPETRGDAFVAYHGSWNREDKSGYCVTRVLFDAGHPYGELVYARFVDSEGNVHGRPVDCAQLGDGSLLISDDHGHRIYRLDHAGEKRASRSIGEAAPAGNAAVATQPSHRDSAAETQHARRSLVDLNPGPMMLFQQSCARCHGPYGSLYGKRFGQMPEIGLVRVVKEMLEGPAGLHPTEATLSAMVAYHRFVGGDQPFLCVTNGSAFNDGKTDELTGEVTPGSTVAVQVKDRTLSAEVDGHRWSLSNVPRGPLRLFARKGESHSVLDFPGMLWPHARTSDIEP